MTLTVKPVQIKRSGDTSQRRHRFRINSFGLRLFLMMMGGVVVGIGGMAFLFGETVKYQAEDQIEATLTNKVSTINDVIDQAEILAYGLNISVKTLHVRRAETPETYQELTRQLFQGRPNFVSGLGFGQKGYGILPSQQWFFPYYQSLPSGSASASTEVVYVDQVKPDYFYPETDRYRDYFLPQVDRWTTPYSSDRGSLLTYYSQIFDDQRTWLGTVVIDIEATHLSDLLDQPVFRDGGELVLLTRGGEIIAYPSRPEGDDPQTYEDIATLKGMWPQIGTERSGFLEGATGYWAYTQIPERNWVLLAHVPYSTVFGPVTLITLGATTVAGLLLMGVVVLAIRYLNHRLRPVLDECHRLSEIDDAMARRLRHKDELEQLSFSFFNLLEQLAWQRPLITRMSRRMRSLEEVVTSAVDEGQQQSQLVTQVKQWVDDTSDLSHILATQALNVKAVGRAHLGAVELSQQQLNALATQLADLGEKIHQLPERVEELVAATHQTTQSTQGYYQIVNTAKGVLLTGAALLSQAAHPPTLSEFAEITTQFQPLVDELQALVEKLSEASKQQLQEGEQVHLRAADLHTSVRKFDRHLREMDTLLTASKDGLQDSQTKAHRLLDTGEQVTESSQQLRTLVQTIQSTVKAIVAIAHSTRARLQRRA